MRRILILALACLCVLSAGCGKKPEPLPSSQESEPVSEAEIEEAPTPSLAAENNKAISPRDVHLIQFDEPERGDKIAVISTGEGDIRIRLFPQQTPKTVEAFIALAQSGYYDGQSFGEIVNGYKIQSVCKADLGENTFPEEPEFSLNLWNFRGAVSLAGDGGNFMIVQAKQCLNPEEELREINFPDIVVEKYLDVGGAPHQDSVNTVFGAVIDGMDIVDKIASGEKSAVEGQENTAVISEITIETYIPDESQSESSQIEG